MDPELASLEHVRAYLLEIPLDEIEPEMRAANESLGLQELSDAGAMARARHLTRS